MIVRKIIRKLIYGYKADSESMIAFLRSRGAQIGDNVVIFEPTNTSIDISRPYLIKIGNMVQITKGCTILTHGYDWSVFKGLYGNVMGKAQTVEIGDNVFIGRNSTIMGGVKIGDNVVIGANSVVTKSIPSNSVVVGAPAKVISNIEDYYIKRKNHQIDDAYNLVMCFYNAFGKFPPEEELREFFWLFTPRKKPLDNKVFDDAMKLLGNGEFSYNIFMDTKPIFNGYQEFLKYCKDRGGITYEH